MVAPLKEPGYLSRYSSELVLDDRASVLERGKRFFSLFHCVQTGSGAHPTSYPMGTISKLPGCNDDQSSSSDAEVKNCGVILTLPPYIFVAW
jgi:hypothetical protein